MFARVFHYIFTTFYALPQQHFKAKLS